MEKENQKKSLLERWKDRSAKKVPSSLIKKAPQGIKHPLSPGQKRLWFLQQMYHDNPFYNYSETYTFKGKLECDTLIESLKMVYNDHDILRTTFHMEDNEVFQKVDENAEISIRTYDLSSMPGHDSKVEAKKIMEADATQYFDLSRSPLVRTSLIKVAPERHILQITLHHILVDEWSMNILREQLALYYSQISTKSPVLPNRNKIQYADYAFWVNSEKTKREHIEYWKKKLLGRIPNLSLPTDFTRPAKPTFKGATTYTQEFGRELSAKILSLSKQLETTPNVLMLSVYYAFLFRLSGKTDIAIGNPVTNRNQKILENIVGFFLNTIVIRTRLSPFMSFGELVGKVRKNLLEAFSHKDVSFDVLVNEFNVERTLSTNPFFQTMFLYQSVPEPSFFGEEIIFSHTWFNPKVSKFDLTIYISEENGILSSTFEYATDLFETATVNRFQDYFKLILKGITSNPDYRISEIPMLTDAGKKLMSGPAEPLRHQFSEFKGIHNIIENVGRKNPDNIALTYKSSSITYKELNDRANILATVLLGYIKTHNEIVGLCAERSMDMIVGMLAILKSGCAYLPIDPEYPEQRINFMCNDAKVTIVVCESFTSHLFENFDIELLQIDALEAIDNPIQEFPETKTSDMAYVIYTSGSTGQPKGVPITHKSIINSTAGRLALYDKNPSAFLLMSSISFDSSKAGIFWTLCTGGNLVIAEKRIEQDIEQIANTIMQNNISHTLMLPSLYQVILDHIAHHKLKTLNTVVVAGEACPLSLCKTHFEVLRNVSLYNEYGPTEASVWCIAHKITPKDLKASKIPIGKPVANTRIYLLDSNLNQVPIGVPGEIYIGGINLSNGYLNRPDLTAKVFVANPFNPNEKLYKTGDLAKYNNHGNMVFLGRSDQQVKIRGYRVEIEAIENTIDQNPFVNKSVVLAEQNDVRRTRLNAYIKPEKSFDEQQLRLDLKKVLPEYMLPTGFILIDELPLLPNGKIDKTALSQIQAAPKQENPALNKKPKNEIEQQLLNIWEDILKIKPLSTNDNFFEVGGDSILSIQIIANARKQGINITPNQIFEHQTISELAMFVSLEKERDNKSKSIFHGEIPLLPIQKWFFETRKNAPSYWNQVFIIKDVPQSVHVDFIKDITNTAVKSHDALRSSFVFENPQWKCIILKPRDVETFLSIDVSGKKQTDQNSKIEKHLKETQERMSLEKGGLFKCIYFETGANTNVIALLAHHLIIDFVSWQMLLNTYTKAMESNKVEEFFKTTSIKTWGEHLLQLAKSKSLENELNYWKNQISNEAKLPLDFEQKLPIREEHISMLNLEMEKELTGNLLNKANEAYSTKVDELLLTAFVTAISNWTKNNSVTLAMERHGRETLNTDMDLSNTVGWFTAFFPKQLNFETPTSDIGQKIIAIKEQMRNIPNGGIGYGISRYLTSNLKGMDYPEIVYNFLGKQSTGNSNIEFLSENTRHPKSERHYYLEMNILIKNGVLSHNWSYANQAFKRKTIEILATEFTVALREIVSHCLNADTTKYTPSDFQDVDLDQEDLDVLLDGLGL